MENISTEGLTRRTEPRMDFTWPPETVDRIRQIFAGVNPQQPRPVPRKIDVYFIRAEITGFIKIGYSDDPPSRMQALRGGPDVLTLELTLPGAGPEGEKEMHRKFAEYRHHGEWFRPGARLERFIEDHREL